MQEVLFVWNFVEHRFHIDGKLLMYKGWIGSRTLRWAEQMKGNMTVLCAERKDVAVTGSCRLGLRTDFI